MGAQRKRTASHFTRVVCSVPREPGTRRAFAAPVCRGLSQSKMSKCTARGRRPFRSCLTRAARPSSWHFGHLVLAASEN